MANQPPNSSRSSAAAFTDVADIGAALVALTGFPAGTLGFQGAGDGYRAFRPGDRLVAKGPTATSEYVVQENLAGTDVVAVQTYSSAVTPGSSPLRFSASPDVLVATATEFPTLNDAIVAMNATVGPAMVSLEVWPNTPVGAVTLPAITRSMQIIGRGADSTAVVLPCSFLVTAPGIQLGFSNLSITGDAGSTNCVRATGGTAFVYFDHCDVVRSVGVEAAVEITGAANLFTARDSIFQANSTAVRVNGAAVTTATSEYRNVDTADGGFGAVFTASSAIASTADMYRGGGGVQFSGPLSSCRFVGSVFDGSQQGLAAAQPFLVDVLAGTTGPVKLAGCSYLTHPAALQAHIDAPSGIVTLGADTLDPTLPRATGTTDAAVASRLGFGLDNAAGVMSLDYRSSTVTAVSATLPGTPSFANGEVIAVRCDPGIDGTELSANVGDTVNGKPTMTLSSGQGVFLMRQGNDWRPYGTGLQAPDIVYVTANPAKYPGMSSAVQGSVTTGIAALPAAGGTLILLDDSYVELLPVAVPSDVRIFSFSRTGTEVTVAGGGPTFLTSGNAEFTNIRFSNGINDPAIRLLGAGTITLTGCFIAAGVTPVAIDAATNDVSLNLVLQNTEISAGSIEGGATTASSVTGTDSIVQAVNLPVGTLIELKGGRFAGLDAATTIDLQEVTGFSGASIGAVTAPVNLSMTNCRLSGGGTIDCQLLTARNVKLNGLYAVTTGGTTILQETDLEDGSTLNQTINSTIEMKGSSVSGDVTTLGTINASFSTFGADVSAVTVNSKKCSFGGAINGVTFLDDHSDINELGGDVTVTSLTWTFTKCLKRVVVAGQCEFNACHVHVAAVGAGGAIVSAGGTVNLRGGTYVRADDTLFSVSGTGFVSAQGSVSGGCRFDVTGVLVVAQTVSDVRGHSVIGPVGLAGPGTTDLTALGGGTNELFDTFVIVENGGPNNVEVYDAAYVPNGFEVVVANYGPNAFDLIPAAGNLFSGGGLGSVTLLVNEAVRFRRVASNDWLVLRY